jgi:hypothetical protein
MSAATAHWLIAWHHQVPLSLALVLSSIWFHTQKTYTAYVADQLMISFWVVGALYEAYMRGPIPVSLTILVLTYNLLVFYAGWLGNCYAFDPDPLISTFFHSTLHFVSFLGVIGVLMSQQKNGTVVSRWKCSQWTVCTRMWKLTMANVSALNAGQSWAASLTKVPSGGTMAMEMKTRRAPAP